MVSIRAVACAAIFFCAPSASAATLTLDFMYRSTPWLHVTVTEVAGGVWIDADVPDLPGEWEYAGWVLFENGITYTGTTRVFHPGILLVLFTDVPAWALFTRPCPPCDDLETVDPGPPPEPCERLLSAQASYVPEPGVVTLVGLAAIGLLARRVRASAAT